jgi:hypothetical protein
MELVNATAWLSPQDHMKVTIWDKSKVYEEGEYTNIDLTVYSLAKYGNYFVSDIDVEQERNGELYLSCSIREDY